MQFYKNINGKNSEKIAKNERKNIHLKNRQKNTHLKKSYYFS